MGILGMSKLIADIAPEAIKEIDIKSLFGRRIAIDASMCIYQFLIAIRSHEQMMTNESGETTSHLVGLFYRSIKMLETGIKPVYVFDGKAPKLKCGELIKRAERRTEAKEKLEEAKEIQDIENIQRFNKRLVRVTSKMTADCKRLLELLGLPIVQAPSEAEAQCVQLCKEGLVYAVATEDMDALTFGCPRLIRHLTRSSNTTEKIKELQIEKILNGINLTQEQFIDLSILMGCDYCDNIKGIGGKKGLELIRKYNNIETILKEKFGITEFTVAEIEYSNRGKEIKTEDSDAIKLEEESINEPTDQPSDEPTKDENQEEKENAQIKDDDEMDDEEEEVPEKEEEEEEEEEDEKPKKGKKPQVTVPENWPFQGARKLFQEPLVLKDGFTENDLKLKDIDEEGLVKFLCEENGFSEERVRNAIKRAKESKSKSNQTRIDTFFKMMPSNVQNSKNSAPKRPQANSKATSKPASKRGRR